MHILLKFTAYDLFFYSIHNTLLYYEKIDRRGFEKFLYLRNFVQII